MIYTLVTADSAMMTSILSENIVEEIRERGVAKSLGGFINRDLNGSGNRFQQMSRIDEAIVNAEINSSSEKNASTIGQSDIYPLDAPGYKRIPLTHLEILLWKKQGRDYLVILSNKIYCAR